MKLAVFSDIHSNGEALNACIQYIREINIDGIIWLGDYVSDCPYPEQTMERIYALMDWIPCWFVRGNREDYMINHLKNPEDGWKSSSSTGSLLYTYLHLRKSDLDFFQKMEISSVIELEDKKPICICHGSMDSTKELLYLNSEHAWKQLKKLKQNYLLCGHTHQSGGIQWREKALWNPGSLGMSLELPGKAQLMVLISEEEDWECKWVCIPYNVEKEIEKFYKSGLYEMSNVYGRVSIKVLREGKSKKGKNILLEMVETAKSLARIQGVTDFTFGIEECFWEEAAKRLQI